MLTGLQIEKAKKALRDAETKRLVQQIMLHHRERVMELSKRFLLPYRLLYDRRYNQDEIPPNFYYPLAGLPKSEKLQTANCISILTESDAVFFLTRFLRDEDFSTYRPFDFTGENLTGEELKNIRSEYISRQRDYLDNIGNGKYYDHITNPNKKKPDDEQRYFVFYG